MKLADARRQQRPLPIDELRRTNYRMIEPGIRPVVRLLIESGYKTLMSCHGHRANRPIIVPPCVILDEPEERVLEAAVLLLRAGAGPLAVSPFVELDGTQTKFAIRFSRRKACRLLWIAKLLSPPPE
jgi:hypothetical protein